MLIDTSRNAGVMPTRLPISNRQTTEMTTGTLKGAGEQIKTMSVIAALVSAALLIVVVGVVVVTAVCFYRKKSKLHFEL